MPRLSKSEITELKLTFEEWQTPTALYDRVMPILDRIGSVDFFNQGGLTFLREAWIASRIGLARNAARARLVKDEWPDFELEINGDVERLEAVEADDPSRRRGQEYKLDSTSAAPDPVEDWIWRADQVPDWLEAACNKKVGKKYKTKVSLVILLNMSEYGIRRQQVEECLRPATARAL